MSDKSIIWNLSGVRQHVHSLVDFNDNITIACNYEKIVLINNFLWYELEKYTHVIATGDGGIDIRISDIKVLISVVQKWAP